MIEFPRMSIGSILDPNYKGFEKNINKKEYNLDFLHFIETYRKYVKPNDLVIEVGGSTLNRTDMLARECKTLTSVEYFPQRMHENFNNVRYVQGDWQELSKVIPANSADMLVSSHVIEHIQDDTSALIETYKVLKKGGIAIINTPNRTRLIRKVIEFFKGPRVFPFGEHFREYTINDLLVLAKKAPFSEIEVIPVAFGVYGLPLFALKKCPSKLKELAIFHELVLTK